MQKISNFIISSVLVLASCSAASVAASQEVSAGIKVVDMVPLETCFAQRERLSRLECYDTLLQRPQIQNTAPVVQEKPEIPHVVTQAWEFLESPDRVDEDVAVTMINRQTGAKFVGGEDGLITTLNAPLSEEALSERKAEYDLFLVLSSDPTVGEDATLIVSCENEITRLKIIYSESFEGRFAEARFYGRETLAGEDGVERKLWVHGQGYMLENARGLDSIRLIQHITAGDLGQIAVGRGDHIRSAFFATPALKKAIPLAARQCSWLSGLPASDAPSTPQ